MDTTVTPDSPITALNGVGTQRAVLFEKLGVQTIRDLLLIAPRRFEDRRQVISIAELNEKGQTAMVRGRVVEMGTRYSSNRTRSQFLLVVDDGTARLHCSWWNAPFIEKRFARGQDLFIYGKVRTTKPRSIDHPDTTILEPEEDPRMSQRLVPVYPLTEGLKQYMIRSVAWQAVELCGYLLIAPHPELPRAGLPSLPEAIRWLHFPDDPNQPEIARQRLALDELIEMQIKMQVRRCNLEAQARAIPCPGTHEFVRPFLSGLPFELTEAQTNVLREIRQALNDPVPMRRLLQGDVGSGKTLVAACTALMVMESGFSTLLMAPTEILANQHYEIFKRWFEPLGLPVHLQTGGQKTLGAERPPSKPKPTLVIGTHALVSDKFKLEKVGLVIIDEQHKFGVAQREELLRKGFYPHLLVMTATPIPRTLGLTLYGDLDISLIDQLPPGRRQIKTFLRSPDKLPQVWEFVRKELAQDRQAYIVYPRVDEDQDGTAKAVVLELESLQRVFHPYRVGILHGRLSSSEKEAVMRDFQVKRVHVLLATPLIEVGIDMPNASVMVIENAEMFGLAQLHQLRGRIGRGTNASYCILITDARQAVTLSRLELFTKTTDGFKIAEADLQIRGPGELLGQQQSGLPEFKFADLQKDLELIKLARTLAIAKVRGHAQSIQSKNQP